MKKRIIIGLTIFTSIFFLGGIHLVVIINKTTSAMDNLITLHQVEIRREQLLTNSRRLQSDLAFANSRFAREMNTVISNVLQLDNQISECLTCHHSDSIVEKINGLKNQFQNYKNFLSRVLTIRSNTNRLEAEENKAFIEGHELIYQLNAMTNLTRAKLKLNTESTLQKINDMKTILFILIFLGPILAVGLAGFFIRGFTKPLYALLQATRKLRGGDLNFRIQGLKDEFAEIAVSFNDMTDSLNEQINKMHRAEQMTIVGEMAAGLIHEIKNPVTGIKAAIQLLIEDGDVREGNRFILTKVMGEIERIESLMRNLLNFAKPSQPQLLPTNMNDLLESTIAFSKSYSSLTSNIPKTITILKNFDPNLPIIMADPMQFQQVFLNIIMNAVEALPKGGTITVKTSGDRLNQRILIEISDTGMGINTDIREKIFLPFFTAKHKGTGLGLAISKKYVEMNGGTISAENNPEGGAVFKIVLPTSYPEEKA